MTFTLKYSLKTGTLLGELLGDKQYFTLRSMQSPENLAMDLERVCEVRSLEINSVRGILHYLRRPNYPNMGSHTNISYGTFFSIYIEAIETPFRHY